MKEHDIKRVYISSDHAGYSYKEEIKSFISSYIDVKDLGPFEEVKREYPIQAYHVANKVKEDKESVGILICGSGIGMAIAANKCKGIRAALCHNILTARLSRQHNDANILCLGARVIGLELAKEATKEFLCSNFNHDRHADRIDLINEIEDDVISERSF